MKASLKLLDDDLQPQKQQQQQRPIVRAKIPLTIGGLPFFSAVSAGSSSTDLQIDLGTALPSGPSARISYRPNHPHHPFRFSLRSGTGPFGSPRSPSPLSFHVDFDPLAPSSPCSFFLHFKPRLGDFSLHKLISSNSNSRLEPYPVSQSAVLEGVQLLARTTLPVRGGASVKFRWGVKLPAEMQSVLSEKPGTFPLPQLLMNKVSVEYIAQGRKGAELKKGNEETKVGVLVREQLDGLKAENSLLKKAVDDLRVDVLGGKLGESAGRKFGELEGMKDMIGTRRGATAGNGKINGPRVERKEDPGTTSKSGEVSAELRKALREAAGGA